MFKLTGRKHIRAIINNQQVKSLMNIYKQLYYNTNKQQQHKKSSYAAAYAYTYLHNFGRKKTKKPLKVVFLYYTIM